MTAFPIDVVRSRFPGLARCIDGEPAVFFDGPAGSQTPQVVIEAVSHYLAHTNANAGGDFATAQESDGVLAAAHAAMADFVGCSDPDEIVFGANMTSLTYQLSEALARTWTAGDEIVVTRADHDANVSPWVQAAQSVGVVVRHVEVRAADATLDLDSLRSVLGPRTRLVAVAAASNLVGTLHPVRAIADLAHAAGAHVFVDAVHYAPHRLVDVAAWDCDFLACSAYKFFGPHVGILWGRRALLAELPSRRLRPAPDRLPGSWMRGTQNHEGIAGCAAAVGYLEALGREVGGPAERRSALRTAFDAIRAHEDELATRLLEGLERMPDVRVWGIASADRVGERTATVGFTHARHRPAVLGATLARAGVFAWPGHSYAVPLSEALGLEPDGLLRVGMLHYNHAGEVDRLLALLADG